jgi:hypothetical protein
MCVALMRQSPMLARGGCPVTLGGVARIVTLSFRRKIKEIDSHMAHLARRHNDAVWLSQLNRTRLTSIRRT